MSVEKSIENYNTAVKLFTRFRDENIRKLKNMYPDIEIENESDAIEVLIQKSNSLDDAFMRYENLFPKDETNLMARFEWQKFSGNGFNTDFLEMETYEMFFENEVNFLLRSGTINGLKGIEKTHRIFMRLREFYEQRFSIPKEKDRELKVGERLYLADLTGFFELDVIKNMSVGNRNKFLSKILNSHTDTIKSYFNFRAKERKGTSSYYPSEEEKIKIEKLFLSLKD